MIKAIMHGVNGKLGQVVVSMAAENDIEIVAGVDVVHRPCTFPVFSDISDCHMAADVIIDFSTATAVGSLLDYVEKHKIPVVLCTTGLSEDILQRAADISAFAPVFISANMSLGINLLASLAKKAAAVLGYAGFDIEIIEKHHNQKIDAPSGTALLLGNAVNESLGGVYDFVYDRSTTREKRGKQEIGMHSLRGGTIVGEHSLVFAGKDEIVEISHSAMSKEIFAVGALKAAKFLAGKTPGMYSMDDLINEL